MFTGIVEELGEVLELSDHRRLVVGCRLVTEDSPVGASVSVNGVCLTVVENTGRSLAFELSTETVARSTLGRLAAGAAVNLERPVTLATRLGGHLVQGHVDSVGKVRDMKTMEGGAVVTILPTGADIGRYLVEKGSVAVDGVSLTVAGLNGSSFSVALIPHTLEVTTMGRVDSGDVVNLEVDVIAKYVERLVHR